MRPSGISHGIFYDNGAEGCFDLGCEHDNYFGRYRDYEAEDGDLDLYLLLGPRLRDVTPKFVALTGRTALPPRWSLGFAQTAMGLADAPDAQAQIRGVIEAAKEHEIPSERVSFRLGLHLDRREALRLHLEPHQIPRAEGADARFRGCGHEGRRQRQALPAGRSSALSRGRSARAASSPAAADCAPLKSQFWDGEGAHLDFTNPAGVALVAGRPD